MRVNRSQASIMHEAVNSWMQQGLLQEKLADSLHEDIHIIPFQWKKAARYSFWIALISFMISIGSVVDDPIIMDIINKFFNSSHALKCISLSFFSLILYGVGINRRRKSPDQEYRNEAILFLGIITTAGAVYQMGQAFDFGAEHYSTLFLISSIVYAGVALYAQSTLIWVFSLFSLGSWMGAKTAYISGWGAYYLGMNYPLRFVVFGIVLICTSLFFYYNKRLKHFFRSTEIMGLLYLFLALWILSIFGDYSSFNAWHKASQIEFFHWSILFGIASLIAIFHGLRHDDNIARGFGIVFLFINLYTRFFEYFWNSIHKAAFFAILGISFWCLGKYAEKIWMIGERNSKSIKIWLCTGVP